MIYYKEWIKTRWFLLLLFLSTNGFAGYAFLRIFRVVELKGAAHLWEVGIIKDSVFIESTMQFVPLIAGILLAIVQFAPEMYHKCLKLTLHLPCSHSKMIFSMLKFGLLAVISCFFVNLLILFFGLQQVFAHELYWHIILTALPWFLAGIAAYLLTSWVVLEPSWLYRILFIAISMMLIRIYFISPYPEAYNGFLPYLTVFTFLLGSLSWISVSHFKKGKQF